MRNKFGLLLLSVCLGFFSGLQSSFAEDNCVKAGDAVGVFPGAPSCCAGLELVPPPAGNYGSAGTCKSTKTCMLEGEAVVVYPNALGCCSGLELVPPPAGVLSSAGTCSKKSAAVVACESKISQIEEVLASKSAPVATDLAKHIKAIVQAVPNTTTRAKSSANPAR